MGGVEIGGQRVVWVALCLRDWWEGVVWVALCDWDWWAGRRVGGAVSLGWVGRASCGWRRVIGMGREGVMWVAPCHWDWWGGRCVAGAVSLGLDGIAGDERGLGGAVPLRLVGKVSCG